GVDLHAPDTDHRGEIETLAAGIDEQADAAPDIAQCSHQRSQSGDIPAQIEAVVGSDLTVAIRHHGDLGGPDLACQLDQSRVVAARLGERIALDVVFDPPAQHGGQGVYVR